MMQPPNWRKQINQTNRNTQTVMLVDKSQRLTFRSRVLWTQCRSRRSGCILRLSVAWAIKRYQKYAQHRLNLAQACQSGIASTLSLKYDNQHLMMALIFTLLHSAASTSAPPVAGPVTHLNTWQCVSQFWVMLRNKDATSWSTHTISYCSNST